MGGGGERRWDEAEGGGGGQLQAVGYGVKGGSSLAVVLSWSESRRSTALRAVCAHLGSSSRRRWRLTGHGWASRAAGGAGLWAG